MPKRIEKRASYVWHPPEVLYKALQIKAQELDLSVNYLVTMALAQWLSDSKKKKARIVDG